MWNKPFLNSMSSDSVYNSFKNRIRDIEEALSEIDDSESGRSELLNTFAESKSTLQEAFDNVEEVGNSLTEVANLMKRIIRKNLELAEKITETSGNIESMSYTNQDISLDFEKAEKITKYTVDTTLSFAENLIKSTENTVNSLTRIVTNIQKVFEESRKQAEQLNRDAWNSITTAKQNLHESLDNLANSDNEAQQSENVLNEDNFNISAIMTDSYIVLISKEIQKMVKNIDTVIEAAIDSRSDMIKSTATSHPQKQSRQSTIGETNAMRSISAWITLEESRKSLQEALDKAQKLIGEKKKASQEVNKEEPVENIDTELETDTITSDIPSIDESISNDKSVSELEQHATVEEETIPDEETMIQESIEETDNELIQPDEQEKGAEPEESSIQETAAKEEISDSAGESAVEPDSISEENQETDDPAESEEITTESIQSALSNTGSFMTSRLARNQSSTRESTERDASNKSDESGPSHSNYVDVRITLPVPVDSQRLRELQNFLSDTKKFVIKMVGGNREEWFIICSGPSPDLIFSSLSEINIIDSAKINGKNVEVVLKPRLKK